MTKCISLKIYTEDRLMIYDQDEDPTPIMVSWYKNIRGVDLIEDKLIGDGIDTGIDSLEITDKHFSRRYLTYMFTATCLSELPPDEVVRRVQYYFNNKNDFDFEFSIKQIRWIVTQIPFVI